MQTLLLSGTKQIRGHRHPTLAPVGGIGESLGSHEEQRHLQLTGQGISPLRNEESESEMRNIPVAEPIGENERSEAASYLQERADFHRIFVEVVGPLKGLNGKRDELDELDEQLNNLEEILQEPAKDTPHEDWAEISVAIELLGELAAQKIQGPDSIHCGRKLNIIQQNLAALLVISNQRWAEHAKAVIVNNLVTLYSEEYDAAYEKSKSTKISAETNFLPVSVGANLRHTDAEATDMEGNFFRKQTVTVGATVSAEVGVNVLKTMGMSLFNVSGSVSGGGGKLEEYAKIKKMVLNEFDKLIEKHAGDTALIPFTCRYSALDQPARPADDQITIHNFAQIRRHYQSVYQRMNHYFDILQGPARHLRGELPPLPRLKPADLEDCSPLQATLMAVDGDATASLGPKIEAMGYQLAGINASSAVNIDRSTVSFERRTPVIEKLVTLLRLTPRETDSLRTPVNMDEELEPMGSEWEEQVDLSESGNQEAEDLIESRVNTDEEPVTMESDQREPVNLSKSEHQVSRANFTDTGSSLDARQKHWMKQKEQIAAEVTQKSQQFLNALALDYRRYKEMMNDPHQPSFLTRLWHLLKSLLFSKYEPGGQRKTLLMSPNNKVPVDFEANLEIWKYNFTLLQNEFEFYSTLQSQLVQGAKGAEQSIQKFHAYYHAKDTEHCLYHMQLLNMKAAVELFKLEIACRNRDDAIATHKEAVLKFEKVLNKPDFDIDQIKLEALISVKDDVTVVSRSFRLGGSVDAGLLPAGTQSLLSAKVAGSVEFSHKLISVPLRRGWFRDYRYSRGWLTQLGSADTVVKFFGATLGKNSPGLEDLPGLQGEVAKHFSGSGGVGRDVTYTRRMFTPDLFPGIGATWLYTVGSYNKKSIASFKVPAPLVTAGGERVNSSSTLKSFTCSSNTMLYFMLLYHHDYAVDKNPVYDGNGKDGDQTNWKGIKKTQREALENFFGNVATRMNPGVEAEKLNNELTIIHKTIIKSLSRNPNYQRTQIAEEVAALEQAQKNFFDASAEFEKSGSASKEVAYNEALDCFQRLMFAYCPHLSQIKADSDIAVPRKLTLEPAV